MLDHHRSNVLQRSGFAEGCGMHNERCPSNFQAPAGKRQSIAYCPVLLGQWSMPLSRACWVPGAEAGLGSRWGPSIVNGCRREWNSPGCKQWCWGGGHRWVISSPTHAKHVSTPRTMHRPGFVVGCRWVLWVHVDAYRVPTERDKPRSSASKDFSWVFDRHPQAHCTRQKHQGMPRGPNFRRAKKTAQATRTPGRLINCEIPPHLNMLSGFQILMVSDDGRTANCKTLTYDYAFPLSDFFWIFFSWAAQLSLYRYGLLAYLAETATAWAPSWTLVCSANWDANREVRTASVFLPFYPMPALVFCLTSCVNHPPSSCCNPPKHLCGFHPSPSTRQLLSATRPKTTRIPPKRKSIGPGQPLPWTGLSI